MLLCKTGSQQPCATADTPVKHLLFIQLCTDATLMHCGTGQGRTAFSLFCAALQNRLTAALCHCSYTYGHLLFIQLCTDAAPKHCSTGQGRTAFSLFCAALQTGSQQPCATAITPMEICSSYNCALMQHQSTAALVKAEQLSHCSVLLCKQAHSSLVPLQLHLWRSALHTTVH